jgi:hypothetical protein
VIDFCYGFSHVGDCYVTIQKEEERKREREREITREIVSIVISVACLSSPKSFSIAKVFGILILFSPCLIY